MGNKVELGPLEDLFDRMNSHKVALKSIKVSVFMSESLIGDCRLAFRCARETKHRYFLDIQFVMDDWMGEQTETGTSRAGAWSTAFLRRNARKNGVKSRRCRTDAQFVLVFTTQK